MRKLVIPAIICMAAALSGCGHRASADIAPTSAVAAHGAVVKKAPESITVSENDITGKKYVSLGDITVTVSKNTLFDSDPNQDMVKAKLQQSASELGADAVVLARYGAVGMTLWSYGSIEGKGRAVKFVE